MYNCPLCRYHTKSLKEHLSHHKNHTSITRQFHCGYNGCRYSFKSEEALRTHLRRHHKLTKCNQQIPVVNKGKNTRHSDASCECQILTCGVKFYDYALYIKHLRSHINNGMTVKCPVNDCNNTTDYCNVSSFASHLSKCHRKISFQSTLPETDVVGPGHSTDMTDNIEMDLPINDSDSPELNEMDLSETQNPIPSVSYDNDSPQVCESSGGDVNVQEGADVEKQFLENFANFMLKLESDYTIPVSTLQFIISELQNMVQYNQIIMNTRLRCHLSDAGMADDQIDLIIQDLATNNPFASSCVKLQTNHKRKCYYKKNDLHVQPQQVSISNENGNSKFFHYVPIIETLRCTFLNKSLKNSMTENSAQNEDSDILTDFTDGAAFKNNEFFKGNPSAKKIILYEDGITVVCPIGSAKKKFKILAIYMTFGDLPSHIRSRQSNIQLVALCKEEWFDKEKVFGTIKKDLAILETQGVELQPGIIEKAGLVYMAGDNLGSNAFGGYSCNFGNGNYVCRFCPIQRDEISECTSDCEGCRSGSKCHTYKPYEKHIYPLRTVESYDECIRKIDKGETNVQGVTSRCSFNDLLSFHVCMPGLPPCLGHDIFEGIAPYDLMLFLKYFVRKKWLTWRQINGRINDFPYSIRDKRDKPIEIDSSKDRVSGKACQIWTLIRLLPLMINDKIKNVNDPVWLTLLLLSEITDIVCSPKINKSYLPHLETIIDEYLLERSRLFPKVRLRPKHHYITHYPNLILIFGPLIFVWTMRFESKHPFFKNVMRKLRNYINVTLTMSEKHELHQSFVRKGSEIKNDYIINDSFLFHNSFYSKPLIDAIDRMNFTDDIKECTSVNIKGTEYRKGAVLVLKQDAYQLNEKMARVILILVSPDNEIYVVTNLLESTFHSHLRAYQINETQNYECVNIKNLQTYQCLDIYTVGSIRYVRLQYAIVH